jgi:hypothetical protein
LFNKIFTFLQILLFAKISNSTKILTLQKNPFAKIVIFDKKNYFLGACRCDRARTSEVWSRNYKSPSSSSSSSSSSDRFRIFRLWTTINACHAIYAIELLQKYYGCKNINFFFLPSFLPSFITLTHYLASPTSLLVASGLRTIQFLLIKHYKAQHMLRDFIMC